MELTCFLAILTKKNWVNFAPTREILQKAIIFRKSKFYEEYVCMKHMKIIGCICKIFQMKASIVKILQEFRGDFTSTKPFLKNILTGKIVV